MIQLKGINKTYFNGAPLHVLKGIDLDIEKGEMVSIMGASGSGKSTDSRQQEISDISRSLKALARELNVPVVALSQLSRAVEQRTDHRPMLTIIRIPRIRESRKSSSPNSETARSEPSIWSGCRIIRNLRMQRDKRKYL